ncbi:MAG: DUF421 domain-containing protein [Clostridia bacterium]|nr:DUF421 domain-containing protein [Clostridia bacterium]
MAVLRTALMYTVLLAVIRLMGKRQVGQMEPTEFVVTMVIANLASIPLEETELPLTAGIVPIVTIFLAERLLSFVTLKSVRLRRLLCGKPVILVENGRPLWRNLRRTMVTMDELMGHLRLKDVMDVRTVRYAILETNGDLSVFPYARETPASAREAGVEVAEKPLPVTVVQDGRIFPDDLKRLGRDEAWALEALRDRKLRPKDVILMTVDAEGQIAVIPKDLPPR